MASAFLVPTVIATGYTFSRRFLADVFSNVPRTGDSLSDKVSRFLDFHPSLKEPLSAIGDNFFLAIGLEYLTARIIGISGEHFAYNWEASAASVLALAGALHLTRLYISERLGSSDLTIYFAPSYQGDRVSPFDEWGHGAEDRFWVAP